MYFKPVQFFSTNQFLWTVNKSIQNVMIYIYILLFITMYFYTVAWNEKVKYHAF